MTQSAKSYPTSPRWLKVFFDIWENRSRTVLVVASIAIGVFAVGMIISAYIVISQDMEISYTGANPANIEIVTNPFEDDFVRTVERLPGVAQAEGRHRTSLRISQDGGATWSGLTVIGFDDFEDAQIFQRETVRGQSAPSDKEILLEARILDDFDLALGDMLSIQLANGVVRDVPVVGFVQDQSIRGGPNAVAVAYITLDTLTWLGEEAAFNQILATVNGNGNDEAHIEAVSLLVEEQVERNGGQLFSTFTSRSNEHPAGTTVLAILSVLGVMGALMLILGGSLIANTLTALLNQQMRQIGVMKLVGARSLQVIGMYLVLILTLGLVSLFLSVPLAGWAGYNVALFFGDLLSVTIDEFRFVPQAILAQIFIAMIVPILAGIAPVIGGARRTVEEAISENDGGGSDREGWFDRLGESLEWLSRPMLISIRNTFRNVRRLLLTLFTLTVAGAIFIAVFNMQLSLNTFIRSVSGLFAADVSVDLGRPYRAEEMTALLGQVPGVMETEAWLGAIGTLTMPDESEVIFTISAPPADTELVKPTLKSGRFLQAGDQNTIVVAETISETFPDIQVGDTLELSINEGREESWTIVGIYFFPGRDVETILSYAPYDVISRSTNQANLVTSIKAVTNSSTLDEQEAFGNQIDARLQAAGVQVRNIEGGLTTVDAVSDGISTLVTLFLGMALLTAVVGSIGLAGTMSMNVLERIREIGILRAIGAVDSAVMSSVMIEGVFIGVLSWLLGIVLSFPISYGLLTMVSLALTNSVMPLYFNPTGFWLWLLVILVLSSLASILPARNASRLTIREVLAYE